MNNNKIPGTLILEGNRTYGKKGNNFLYKFVPHKSEKCFTNLLVPFSMKQIGFSKCMKNKYVLVEQRSDNEGSLILNIGDTDIISNFFEYNLYCRNLQHSIKQFVTDATLASKAIDLFASIPANFEDRTSLTIISIDPKGSVDIDDAFGLQENTLSVYISNVPFVLDKLNLWNHLMFSEERRISSIYLPNKKIPMLPPILSDNLCSLLQGETRAAVAMDVTFKDGMIDKVDYRCCFVKVSKNYTYDEIDCGVQVDTLYNKVFEMCKSLNSQFSYLKSIKDSHDVIALLMILMNHQVGKFFQQRKCGIFRKTCSTKNISIPSNIPESLSSLLLNMRNGSGKYCLFEDNLKHNSLNLDAYVHVTSPIRRLVDLLNIHFLIENDQNNRFVQSWYSRFQMDYINSASKNIRKLQNECSIIQLITNDPNVLSSTYEGYVIDIIQVANPEKQLAKYLIYLDKLNVTLNYATEQSLDIGNKLILQVILFSDETSLRQKIRLQIKHTQLP